MTTSFQNLALFRQAKKEGYSISKIEGFPQGRLINIPKKEFLDMKRRMKVKEEVDADIQITGIIKNSKRIPKKFVIGIRKDLKGNTRKEAISHELGHYFFAKLMLDRKIKAQNKDIKEIIKKNPSFRGQKQEIIADIIGQARINKTFKKELRLKHPKLFSKLKKAL